MLQNDDDELGGGGGAIPVDGLKEYRYEDN